MATPEVKLKPVDIAVKKYYDRTRRPDYYLAGVRNPKRSPTEAALSMADTWHRKVSLDETKEKWMKRRAAVGDEGWIAGIELKGVARYPQGTEIGSVKMMDFLNKFYPHLAEGLKKVYSIPRVTIDDSIERVATLIRHNHEFTYEPSKMTAKDIKALLEKVKSISIK